VRGRSLALILFGFLLFAAPAQAAKLYSWKFSDHRDRLSFKTGDAVRPVAKLIPNPTRLVVDLPGVILGYRKVTKTIGDEVKEVRVGQADRNTTRLVIELAAGYSVDPNQIKIEDKSGGEWVVDLPKPEAISRSLPPGEIQIPVAGVIASPAQMPRVNPKREAIGKSVVPNKSKVTSKTAISGVTSKTAIANVVDMGEQMKWLQQRVAALQPRFPGISPGMYFLDLDTGNYLDLRGGKIFPAASVIKLPILIAFFQDVDAGKISLNEMLVMRPSLVASGSGDMQYMRTWSKFSALYTASRMITISDNTATNMIIKRMGGISVLNRRFSTWGLKNTRIRNWLPDLSGTNTTTAQDMVQLLALFSKDKLLSAKSKNIATGILRRTKTRTLLPAGLGPGALIAHKTGDIGFAIGDAGVVEMPTGKRYLAAVLLRRPYDDVRGRNYIRTVSQMVYTYFKNDTNPRSDTGFKNNTGVMNPEIIPQDVESNTIKVPTLKIPAKPKPVPKPGRLRTQDYVVDENFPASPTPR
jgi:beta-lactamase class A